MEPEANTPEAAAPVEPKTEPTEVVQEDPATQLSPKVPALTRDLSLRDQTEVVAFAFYSQFEGRNNETDKYESWHVRVFPTYVIAKSWQNKKHYKVTYTMVSDSEVAFDDRANWPVVEMEWNEVSETERSFKANLYTARGVEMPVDPGTTAPAAAPQKPSLNLNAPYVRSAHEFVPGGEYTAHYRHGESCIIRTVTGNDNQSTFFFATGLEGRDGYMVDIDTLDVGAYARNGVVLWEHGKDPNRGMLPVAKSLNVVKRTINDVKGWLATVEWWNDDFSRTIRDLVKDGFLNMPSLKWQPRAVKMVRSGDRDVPLFVNAEMLEFSVVAVGGDAATTVVSRSADGSSAFDPAALASLEERVNALAQKVEAPVFPEQGTPSSSATALTLTPAEEAVIQRTVQAEMQKIAAALAKQRVRSQLGIG